MARSTSTSTARSKPWAKGLRTTFRTVPDAPVSSFILSLNGGKKGLLENNANLCKAPLGMLFQLNGQNGAVDNQSQKLAAPCGNAAKHKRHLQRAREVG